MYQKYDCMYKHTPHHLTRRENVKKRTNKFLIKKEEDISETNKIMVILQTTESIEKGMKYRTILGNYFSDNGSRDVVFMEKEDKKRK